MFVADHGSYWFVGAEHNTSAYNGLGFLDLSSYQLHKVLFDVRCQAATPSEVIVRPGQSTRVSDTGVEQFFFRDRLACYSFEGAGKVDFFLDVRDTNDFGAFSRSHTVDVLSSDPWVVRVRGADGAAFVFVCSQQCVLLSEWRAHPTEYDRARSHRPEWFSELFMRSEGSVRVVIAPESRLFEAKQVLKSAWDASEAVWDDNVEYAVAKASVESLLTKTPTGSAGILAGLPWFFQIYTRDEAIAAGALIATSQHLFAAKILLREISVILPDGRIPNRFPHSDVGSADGVGWAFLRLHQIFSSRAKTLSLEQWKFVFAQLKVSLSRLAPGCFGVLIQSAAQETWMDTTGGVGDTREGSRIEIQALTLRMLRFASELAQFFDEPERFAAQEDQLRSFVHSHLFDGTHLFDGCQGEVADTTARPNALLCRYIYPWLLSDEEWCRVADSLLSRLATDWGGLRTIDPSHTLFVDTHTGEDDRSYHRGDVWFFLNNLIATGLVDLDPRYRPFAQHVYDASRKDLLAMGAAGHSSEISSARAQEALGCWCQAWSASSFVELALALDRTKG